MVKQSLVGKKVARKQACPKCGNRNLFSLQKYIKKPQHIQCLQCGTVYGYKGNDMLQATNEV